MLLKITLFRIVFSTTNLPITATKPPLLYPCQAAIWPHKHKPDENEIGASHRAEFWLPNENPRGYQTDFPSFLRLLSG
ncbi:MAG: hypothetical protein H0X25_22900 [Acidobacteriales bacterium]|nr:hypothetical protein [Terriglobales bacterium]